MAEKGKLSAEELKRIQAEKLPNEEESVYLELKGLIIDWAVDEVPPEEVVKMLKRFIEELEESVS